MNCKSDLKFLNKTDNKGYIDGTTGVAPAYDSKKNYIGLIDCFDSRWGKSIFGVNKFNTNISPMLSIRNRSQLEKGTHPFQGDNNPSRKSVSARTHHWLKENNSNARKIIDDYQRKLVLNGSHYWQSDEHKINTGQRTRKAIIDGKHPCGQDVTCPYCAKVGQKTAMYRWHFNNCKMRSG